MAMHSDDDYMVTEEASVGYQKRTLIDHVNLHVKKGEILTLIGPNGVGKSTLFKCIVGEEKPDCGTIRFGAGVDIGYYDQHQAHLHENKTVLDEVWDDFHRLDQTEVRGALGLFLFTGDDVLMPISTLSGGEKGRVALTKLMLKKDNVLLLDEPTNNLDNRSVAWLEDFLMDYDGTVLVVSHDRYFLNNVCTHIVDIDYGKIKMYVGNYDFWYESSQLMVKQMKEANKKKEEKIKELQEFIQRFSANASKSKQATSRKRALEKIELDDIRPSSRKYPYIDFRPAREIGNEVLTVTNLSKTVDGVKVLDNVSFIVGREDKIALVGSDELAKTTLFKILAGELEPDEGSYKWGITTSTAYFPKDNTKDFDCDDTIVEWLMQFSPEKDVTYVRGFLGRMLFAGDDGVKKVKVLSGGEKVRVMLSKMMIMGANVLLLDQPTNHLDMESITALNNGLIKFPGAMIFASHDHQFVQTTANRIMEFVGGRMIDKITTYDEYLESDEMARKRQGFVALTEEQLEENDADTAE